MSVPEKRPNVYEIVLLNCPLRKEYFVLETLCLCFQNFTCQSNAEQNEKAGHNETVVLL